MNDPEQKSLEGTTSESTEADAAKRRDRDKLLAAVLVNPAVTNAITINRFAKVREACHPTVLAEALSEQIAKLNAGNMDGVEGILLAQAHTLNHIFGELAQRALDAPGLDLGERCMKLALKAQDQCRASVETLAALKNTQSIAVVKQTNIAHGPQQINNAPTRGQQHLSGSNQNRPNELLESTNEQQRVDIGTANTSGINDSQLATVEAVNGAEDSGR